MVAVNGQWTVSISEWPRFERARSALRDQRRRRSQQDIEQIVLSLAVRTAAPQTERSVVSMERLRVMAVERMAMTEGKRWRMGMLMEVDRCRRWNGRSRRAVVPRRSIRDVVR